MKKQQPISFTIKCQCSAYKNGMLVTSKKKSKLSNLQLNYKQKTIAIIPHNSKDQHIIFELKRLKHIHRKFVTQGKITLQFTQQIDKNSSVYKIEENKVERLSQILVETASPENLQLLIKKIIELKRQISNQKQQQVPTLPRKDTQANNKKSCLIKASEKKQHLTTDDIDIIKSNNNNNKNNNNNNNVNKPSTKHVTNVPSKRQSQYPKMIKFSQGIMSRKKDPMQYNQRLKQYEQQENNKQIKMSRKQLMKQALNPTVISQKPLLSVQTKDFLHREVDILELPSILLQKVFEFTKIELRYRLISKKFDSFVLKNISTLKFHDDIDEQTFNKLAKYTINVKGRLKNVRSLQLIDLHDDRQLQKNRSKSLFLGQWKQISKKNAQQIKGLRVYLLEIPYQIKFNFDAFYGIRLKQLHLVSRTQITTQNSLITDENLIYLFKNVNQLQVFSIPYVNSIVLEELGTKLKHKAEKLRVLKIGCVNQNCKGEEGWWIMHIYEKLQQLQVQKVLKGGIWKSEARYAFTFPQHLNQLTLGSVASQQTLHNLPTSLTRLKLTGDNYYNNDIADVIFLTKKQIYLPYLKVLDLSECLNVRPSVIDLLDKCNRLKIITNWDKQDVQYWKQMATNKDIEIISIKGMIIKK